MATKSKGGIAAPAAPAVGTFGPAATQGSVGRRTGGVPPAPAAPTVIPVAGGVQTVPTSAPLDPRDAAYYAQRAQELFNVNTQKGQLDAQGGIDQRNFAEALRQLAQDQPLAEQSTRENYNRQGLFYSGHLGQALNQLAQSYATKRAGAQNALTDADAARTAARAALDAGYSVSDAADLAAAVDRRSQLEAAAAASNSLVPNQSASTKPAPAHPARSKGGTARPR